ncbi:hypothetical protein [Sulfitobacter mediterraneus]|jgi:hypothetical protein|uniref:Uncharacterized protein n=1 Tax=Sulfitobacter mediterraneus TaxID=83219 RepID=A0A2T6CC27_9RHOB|nr:hypothetical protein [Sulfitobacter mediterraneus]KIN79212.1 hypothetical protein Z950_2855 [Sulfitobacter mediterraneus KCTC 32188]PTX73051.1 hypothetical protein C8N31_109137 [Sulfitobacter mediterraneus]
MMWQLQPMIAWMMSAQGSNVTFALICTLALCGIPVRWVVVLTIILHLSLAFASGSASAAL